MSKFKGCRVARMSSGRYCVIRDLGLVKGGKGMRRHEELVVLTPKGIRIFLIATARGLLVPLTEGGKAQQSGICVMPRLAKSIAGRKLLAGATAMFTTLASLAALISSQRLSIQRRIQHVRAVQHQEQRK
jgi:hypothetical protein